MKDLIEFIATSLVEEPEKVQVIQEGNNSRPHLKLRVAKNDMGRVIGKDGRIANSIRILLRVAAARVGKQATLDVIEPQ